LVIDWRSNSNVDDKDEKPREDHFFPSTCPERQPFEEDQIMQNLVANTWDEVLALFELGRFVDA
jgi:hypothetical protein